MSISTLVDLLLRPVCWVTGHRWSDWHSGGYYLRPDQYRPGQQNRLCWLCNLDEFRPEPAVVGYWTEEAAPPHAIPIPVYEVPDAGEVADALVPAYWPPWVEAFTSALTEASARPVEPRANVVNRDVMGDAVLQIGASVQAMQGKPEHERQLEATRQMLAEIGRQLDEVTGERDELLKERKAGLPPSAVDLQRQLDIAQHQLEEITRDRDRLEDVSARRLTEVKSLRKQVLILLKVVRAAGITPAEQVVLALAPSPRDQTADHPVTVRPERR